MTKNKKILAVCMAAMLACSFFLLPCYADADSIYVNLDNVVHTQNSAYRTSEKMHYDSAYTKNVVNACLSYAYIQCQRGSSQIMFKEVSGGNYVFSSGVLVPLFITGRYNLDNESNPNPTSQCLYFVYFAVCQSGSAVYTLEDTPEEWGAPGAAVRFKMTQGSVKGLLSYIVYRDTKTGAITFVPLESPGTTFATIDNKYVDISFCNTTTNAEQIIYSQVGVGAGYNEYYQYGTVSANNYVQPKGYAEWYNAYLGYIGESASGGFTQDDIDNAYEDGYLDGVQIGFNQGREDGYATGYATGYDKGREDGYDKGYDKGYDTGYDVGFSRGAVEIDIGGIISAVPEGAKSIINGALGFEVFGINVAGTLTALLVVAIVAYVVRKLMSR